MSLCLSFDDDNLGLQIRRFDVGDEAPLKPGMQTLFNFRNVTRGTIRSQDNLFLPIIQGIECVEKLFLSSLLTRDELNVVDEKDIDTAITLTKGVGLVVAISDCANQFVHEPFKREIGNPKRRVNSSNRVTDCLNEMSFPKSHTAVKIERVVCLTRRL